MADTDTILKEIHRLEKEAYQRGWNDAAAKIVAVASQGVPVAKQPSPKGADAQDLAPKKGRSERREHAIPIIDVILGVIQDRPGLRGAEIFREAVNRVSGSNFKTMDRSGRTALARLKTRGKIRIRQKRWYAVTEVATAEEVGS